MASKCNLTVNGRTVRASVGETLVDAAMGGWIAVPHDCCSGQCETCRVRVVSGSVDDQGTGEGDTVLACQATLEGDAVITYDEVPEATKRAGQVAAMRALSRDVVEVIVELRSPLDYLPGQYVSVTFAGFPPRDYSPTLHWDGTRAAHELVFHIRMLPDGIVSSELGRSITPGHRVDVRGPFGHAFFRRGDGLMVLVAGGTGWAPIWAVAHEAVRARPRRDIIVIVGARDHDGLYMRQSLDWLRDHGAREVIATSRQGGGGLVRSGRPTNYLPLLGPSDMVYVAGAPGLVDAVKLKALSAGAFCFADPFLPSQQRMSFMDRMARLLRTPGRTPVPQDAGLFAPQMAGADDAGRVPAARPANRPAARRLLQETLFAARRLMRRE
ncbi:2Fe-2S iron-sulfur cluster binding domain-containing protein [Chelatococcus daeguensis]|uniref:2Fe-2S iron-sulfur cluster-binding protein n=1 Tax=Chelatococcus daeguensis TaxID=444444 RepID=UPI0007AB59A3|nr:2Fe-2S iron-sulfur cluster-binding protein [Chelatococcus daeguensis]KZE36735.1 ferredoxin [Chelatococcus daeguensis]MBM3082369.1 2Fe-2S iron-sulfur cluster binding domain-containing protein [Chelatococcus daeguensis]